MGTSPVKISLFSKGRVQFFSFFRRLSGLMGASLESAKAPRIPNSITNPDIPMLTNKINSVCRNRRLDDALSLFDKMPARDAIAWNSMLKGCLDCGRLRTAEKLFDKMPQRYVISWTTMINGYFQFGAVDLAVGLFRTMPTRDVTVWNSMIHGYCVNGRVNSALELFEKMPYRNIISWTSMMSGLDQNGRSLEALGLFHQMMSSGFEPASSTLCCVITACEDELALKEGLQIHSVVIKSGYVLDEFITTSLISFYAKCKRVGDFSRVFHEIKSLHNNVVVWTSLLTAYCLTSNHISALMVFRDMLVIGVFPNQSTFTSALNACVDLEALDRGKEIHSTTVKLGFLADAFVGNSLIVLYSKCGSINDGVTAFTCIEDKNLVSWNSIISGCAQHGHAMWAFSLFAQMIRAKRDPDGFTLTGLLYACSKSGIFMKGESFLEYFSEYKAKEVRCEHYACMVDIMGRCGKLNEAVDFIENMPIKGNSMVWLALLSACKMHSNLEVAEKAAKCVIDLDPGCSVAYIQLSNLFASAGKWGNVSRVRQEMKERGLVKQHGCSWVT